MSRFEGNNNFCKCDFSQSCPKFGICGGTLPNSGGNCGAAACTEKLHTFSDNTWIIKVDKKYSKDNPYRAFAYLYFKPSSKVTFSFTFKAKGHNNVYSKLFFWGDGNNILGLLPPSGGGSSKFCLMPTADDPPPTCPGGTHEVKDDTWYRVDLELTPPSSIKFSVNGKEVGTGKIQSSMNQVNPMLGVYHWARSTPSDYWLHYRDMCVGTSSVKR